MALHAKVSSSRLHGWTIEVYDDSRPWGAPPVGEYHQLKRPTAEDKRAILGLHRQRAATTTRERTAP